MNSRTTQMPGARMPMAEGGPWGERDEDGDKKRANRGGPRNPWTPPAGEDTKARGGRGPSAIDELIRRARETFGGGLPERPNGRSFWPYIVGGVVLIWIATTSFHSIGAKERGIVSFLGSYSRELSPGARWTLPAPLETVTVIDVDEIRTIDLGSAGDESQKLVLTGDQNIINLGYSVRWNIRDAEQFAFQIAEPEQTISEVSDSAMRAVIATVSLADALGAGRNAIEAQVQNRIQEILDGYGAGIRIQGVAIKQADPPEAVVEAFKDVTAAQQEAESYLNSARAYAQQIAAQSQGEAAAFDLAYEQYRLAPDVTRRRMYYETMEKVLGGVNKTIIEANGVTPYLPLPAVRPPARPSASVEGGGQQQAQGGGQ